MLQRRSDYLQTEASIDPSSLTHSRKRIGEEGVETLLMATVEAVRRGGVLKASSDDRVIVDTTVMPKAIAHPTDSRLLDKSCQHLVAEEHGMTLRQNYNCTAPKQAAQIGRYAHAKQFKPMRKAVRTLRTRVGRVQHEVQRQLDGLPELAQADQRLARPHRPHLGMHSGHARLKTGLSGRTR